MIQSHTSPLNLRQNFRQIPQTYSGVPTEEPGTTSSRISFQKSTKFLHKISLLRLKVLTAFLLGRSRVFVRVERDFVDTSIIYRHLVWRHHQHNHVILQLFAMMTAELKKDQNSKISYACYSLARISVKWHNFCLFWLKISSSKSQTETNTLLTTNITKEPLRKAQRRRKLQQ